MIANNTMNPKQGFAGIMREEQHYLTRTHGRKAIKLSTSAPYRQELAADLADYIGILKKDGSWTPQVRQSLMRGLDNFKREFPDLFRKDNKMIEQEYRKKLELCKSLSYDSLKNRSPEGESMFWKGHNLMEELIETKNTDVLCGLLFQG